MHASVAQMYEKLMNEWIEILRARVDDNRWKDVVLVLKNDIAFDNLPLFKIQKCLVVFVALVCSVVLWLSRLCWFCTNKRSCAKSLLPISESPWRITTPDLWPWSQLNLSCCQGRKEDRHLLSLLLALVKSLFARSWAFHTFGATEACISNIILKVHDPVKELRWDWRASKQYFIMIKRSRDLWILIKALNYTCWGLNRSQKSVKSRLLLLTIQDYC
jgi:hypothetical protein